MVSPFDQSNICVNSLQSNDLARSRSTKLRYTLYVIGSILFTVSTKSKIIMEFSEDIKKLLKDKYPDKDIYKMSLGELKLFREEIENLREEYSLIELGAKTLSNSLYGASANKWFYFYNLALAGDITAECRQLTKTMWNKLEDFFHNEIWNRKDLWEKFNFELDPNKRKTLTDSYTSIYSDTDSCFFNSFISIINNDKKLNITIEDLYNSCEEQFGKFTTTTSGQEMVNGGSIKVLNWTKENGLHYVPVKYVMRHKVRKPRYKIRTKSGKEIVVTGDHSCVVFRDGKQLTIKAKDINVKTDKILSISYIGEK